MGVDLFDSFVNYQTRVIQELDRLSEEYGFESLEAGRPVEETAEDLADRVIRLLDRRPNLLAEPQP